MISNEDAYYTKSAVGAFIKKYPLLSERDNIPLISQRVMNTIQRLSPTRPSHSEKNHQFDSLRILPNQFRLNLMESGEIFDSKWAAVDQSQRLALIRSQLLAGATPRQAIEYLLLVGSAGVEESYDNKWTNESPRQPKTFQEENTSAYHHDQTTDCNPAGSEDMHTVRRPGSSTMSPFGAYSTIEGRFQRPPSNASHGKLGSARRVSIMQSFVGSQGTHIHGLQHTPQHLIRSSTTETEDVTFSGGWNRIDGGVLEREEGLGGECELPSVSRHLPPRTMYLPSDGGEGSQNGDLLGNSQSTGKYLTLNDSQPLESSRQFWPAPASLLNVSSQNTNIHNNNQNLNISVSSPLVDGRLNDASPAIDSLLPPHNSVLTSYDETPLPTLRISLNSKSPIHADQTSNSIVSPSLNSIHTSNHLLYDDSITFPEDDGAFRELERSPCTVCKRLFATARLPKHLAVCKQRAIQEMKKPAPHFFHAPGNIDVISTSLEEQSPTSNSLSLSGGVSSPTIAFGRTEMLPRTSINPTTTNSIFVSKDSNLNGNSVNSISFTGIDSSTSGDKTATLLASGVSPSLLMRNLSPEARAAVIASVPCPHCNRTFSSRVAANHIPSCTFNQGNHSGGVANSHIGNNCSVLPTVTGVASSFNANSSGTHGVRTSTKRTSNNKPYGSSTPQPPVIMQSTSPLLPIDASSDNSFNLTTQSPKVTATHHNLKNNNNHHLNLSSSSSYGSRSKKSLPTGSNHLFDAVTPPLSFVEPTSEANKEISQPSLIPSNGIQSSRALRQSDINGPPSTHFIDDNNSNNENVQNKGNTTQQQPSLIHSVSSRSSQQVRMMPGLIKPISLSNSQKMPAHNDDASSTSIKNIRQSNTRQKLVNQGVEVDSSLSSSMTGVFSIDHERKDSAALLGNVLSSGLIVQQDNYVGVANAKAMLSISNSSNITSLHQNVTEVRNENKLVNTTFEINHSPSFTSSSSINFTTTNIKTKDINYSIKKVKNNQSALISAASADNFDLPHSTEQVFLQTWDTGLRPPTPSSTSEA